MPDYSYFDVVLQSEIELPELCRASQPPRRQSAISVRQSYHQLANQGKIEWYENITDTEDPANIACGRLNDHYVMRFTDLTDFAINVEAQEIVCHADAECPPATLRHLLLDQALPQLIGQQGRPVLHASMACAAEGAIGFIGRSGWGKSTLAASFATNEIGPCGDDALLLGRDSSGQAVCWAAYNGTRLWADAIEAVFDERPASSTVSHYYTKRRIKRPMRGEDTCVPIPLRALFLLNNPLHLPSVSTQISSVAGSEALMALLKRCFLLNPQDMAVSRNLWLQLGDLLRGGLPIFQLQYARDFTVLPAVQAEIRAALSALYTQQIVAAS